MNNADARTPPLELLAEIIGLADKLLQDDRLTASEQMLNELWQQAEAERTTPREQRIVGDEAAMLVRCLQRIVWARLEKNGDAETRWVMLAGAFLPFARTDLARARAQLG